MKQVKNLNLREQNIRLAILRAIRTHRNDLVRADVILTEVFRLIPVQSIVASDIEAVLTKMDDAGELYHTDSFAGRRFYGIKGECEVANCQKVCRKAEEVEGVIVDAFNSFTHTERALLLARLVAIVDEVSHLPE